MFDVLCPGCNGDFAKVNDYLTHDCPGLPGEAGYKPEEIDWYEWGEEPYVEHPLAGMDRVRELHSPMNGPYDDRACSHCTELVHEIARIAGIEEPIYIPYPCMTIITLGE
jgi:hypothetical protein